MPVTSDSPFSNDLLTNRDSRDSTETVLALVHRNKFGGLHQTPTGAHGVRLMPYESHAKQPTLCK